MLNGIRQFTGVDLAFITFGTADGDWLTIFDGAGCISGTNHRRNTKLTRNDCGMADTPTPVGNDGGSRFHHRFPGGVGHISHQHLARLKLSHVLGVSDNTGTPGTDTFTDALSDGT